MVALAPTDRSDLIVALDLAGGAALAYALTRISTTVKKVVVNVPASQIQPATGTDLTVTHLARSRRCRRF